MKTARLEAFSDGVLAILIARRTTRSSEDGSSTMVDHLVTGSIMATRSAAICA